MFTWVDPHVQDLQRETPKIVTIKMIAMTAGVIAMTKEIVMTREIVTKETAMTEMTNMMTATVVAKAMVSL